MRRVSLIALFIAVASACASCSRTSHKSHASVATHPSTEHVSTQPKEIKTELGVVMVLVPAGEFVMGDAEGEPDEKPPHRVHIDAFLIDKFEVTQQLFEKLMGRNPSKFKGPENPVDRVSWVDAARFCNMRSRREGLTPCYDPKTFKCDFSADGYRLPTEAEWEYACRAGTTTRYFFGDDPAKLGLYAWYEANSNKRSHRVGQKLPNPWGLFDMYGNVWEWCNDYYSADYYAASPHANPTGPPAGKDRVLRGGCWASSANECRSAARLGESPAFADVCFGYEMYGFRCVRRANQ